MKREFLKELGLSDEQIEKIMAEHGKTVNSMKDELEKAKELEKQIEGLKEQIKQRDEQLEELKKIDAEGLQAKIKELQEANERAEKEWQEKLQKQTFDFALERALVAAKARNPKAVKALLDLENIKLDGEKLLGLEDQLKKLKESDSYLFEEEKKGQPPQIVASGNPDGGKSTEKDPFAAKLAKYKT